MWPVKDGLPRCGPKSRLSPHLASNAANCRHSSDVQAIKNRSRMRNGLKQRCDLLHVAELFSKRYNDTDVEMSLPNRHAAILRRTEHLYSYLIYGIPCDVRKSQCPSKAWHESNSSSDAWVLASSSLTESLSVRSPNSHPIEDTSRRNTPRFRASLSTVDTEG